MKTLLTITAILLGLTAQSQTSSTLLNVTGSFAKDSVPPLRITGFSNKIVNGYEKLIINPTQYSGLTFNQNHWVFKSTQDSDFSDLEINSKYEKPITFTIDDVVYLVYQKKVYRLLK